MARACGSLALVIALALAGCGKAESPEPTGSASATAPADAASASEEVTEPAASASAMEPAAEASAEPEPATPAITSYPPRDDCAKQAGWREFRAQLSQAVARRDADALVALTAPDVQLDYGGGHGTDELRKRLVSPDYRLWDKLGAILPLGCGFQGGLAAMPWIFWNTPESLDPYQGMWVTGTDVALHDKPAANAPSLATLDWALVEAAPHKDANPKFMKVTPAGTKLTGYVAATALRSVIDYRVIAEPKDGAWRITAFIAGD
ncbi:MAG: hypothetical protein RIS94_1727 [Pseudomonadota bacterium]|jgi:hypothetical protein